MSPAPSSAPPAPDPGDLTWVPDGCPGASPRRPRRRNQNYLDILRLLSLGDRQLGAFDISLRFTHLFWFGDLNYRLDMDIQVRAGPVGGRAGRRPLTSGPGCRVCSLCVSPPPPAARRSSTTSAGRSSSPCSGWTSSTWSGRSTRSSFGSVSAGLRGPPRTKVLAVALGRGDPGLACSAFCR